MYKIFNLVTFIIVANISIGQASLEEKLKEVFNQDKVTTILESDSKKQYYQKIMFNSYELKTIDSAKTSNASMPVLKLVTIINAQTKERTENDNAADIIALINKGSFNILLTNVKRDFSNKTYYRLKNTNKVLVVYSHQDIYKK